MKKAFLVGINKYPNAPLSGCVNDVVLMYKILSEKFDFDKSNIRLMTDTEATKQNILSGLKELIKGVVAGDTIYFHYSGHGSQVVVDDWTNNDEPDGRDEIICPIDLDWNDPLRDHQLSYLFKLIPEGVKIVVVLDCCHSGSGLRNMTKLHTGLMDGCDWVNRFLPPPPSNILSNPKIEIDDDLCFLLPTLDINDRQTQKRGFIVDTSEQGNVILIGGCEDGQTSADAFIGGRYHGALTYLMVETLADSNFNISYQKLVHTINNKTNQLKFTQNPQLECKKEYFDVNFLA